MSFSSASRLSLAATLFAGTAFELLAGCAWTPVEPYEGTAPRTETVYVVALGWHTEVGLRADAIHGPLMALAREFPSASYLMFGWGLRDYYMAINPSFPDLLRAIIPGSAVMLISALPQSPSETFGTAHVYVIPVSPEGMDRLSDYLWGYFEKDAEGGVRRIGGGPYAESAFYIADGIYDIGNTCNTWTAEALKVSGLPVRVAGVVFASQVTDQIRGLAVPDASGSLSTARSRLDSLLLAIRDSEFVLWKTRE